MERENQTPFVITNLPIGFEDIPDMKPLNLHCMQYPEICPGCNEYYDAAGQMLEPSPGKLIRYCPRCEEENETEDRDDHKGGKE